MLRVAGVLKIGVVKVFESFGALVWLLSVGGGRRYGIFGGSCLKHGIEFSILFSVIWI